MPDSLHKQTIIVGLLVTAFLVYLWFAPIEDTKANRLLTILVAAVTAIYALTTYEILLQNRAMARSAAESARIMEQQLRFSGSANLFFSTLNTKEPALREKGYEPFRDDEYRNEALREHAPREQQREYVFAVVRNVGPGTATTVAIDATYRVRDTANPNRTYTRTRVANIQILESNKAIAVFVYVARAPTHDDEVQLVRATVRASDLYRDALGIAAVEKVITPENHEVEIDPECVLRVS